MKTYAILAAAMAVTGTTTAHAENGSGELAEGKAFLDSKVTIAQAAANAEAQGAGKVSSVNFVARGGSAEPFYHVEVIADDGSQQDLAVNAATGEVTKIVSTEEGDQGENDHEGEKE